MMICDSHIHIGQFNDFYNSWQRLSRLMRSMHISKVAISSTTTCVNPVKALREIRKAEKMGGSRVIPVLWITKWMIDSGYVDECLKSGILWKCLKIHGQLEPNVWFSESSSMVKVVDIAKKLKLPILIHTSQERGSRPMEYYDVMRENSDVTFILAHGRPLISTLRAMEHNHNVYMDTAFTPIEDVKILIDNGMSDRILWGTDCLVNRYFKDNPCHITTRYYHSRLAQLHRITTRCQRNKILYANFNKVFLNNSSLET